MAPMRAAGAVAASLATATAAVTVLAYSVALARDDLGLGAEDQVPAWLRLAELAAVAVAVAGTWAVRVDHPRASTGLAVGCRGVAAPALGGMVLAAGAGARRGARGSAAHRRGHRPGCPGLAAGGHRRAHVRAGRAVVVLAGAASLAHLLGYNPFADPGCARTCDDVRPILDSVLSTKSAVAITCALTIVAAILAAATVLRGSPSSVPRGLIGAVALTLGLLAGSLALRWAGWGATTPSVPLLVVEPLAVAVVGAVLCSAGIRTIRTRAAVNRLGTRLSAPETALSDLSGAIRGVQFAVPGDARWVDPAGRDVRDAPAPGRYVVLSDESGPMLRLLLAGRADQQEALAGLTPAAWLALRNAQLAAVVKARLADVQASQRRVVAMADAERRRIERDLHDGAQQRLVSVAFHLRVALRGVDPATAAPLMSTAARVHDALAHLRQLAHGIFPSVLANEGLEAALDELLAASDVPATLDIQVGNVGADAAMAAYAAVAAALASVGHPSAATQARISAVQDRDTLTVRVEVHAGSRTTGAAAFSEVADRVGALGGRFTLSGTPEDETVVTAVIPCAS